MYLTVRLSTTALNSLVKVTYGVFLDNFYSGNHGPADERCLCLSLEAVRILIDIYRQANDDSSDNADCNFLVSN